MKFKVILEEGEEAAMSFMSLPFLDVFLRVETREEAIENIREAIEVYLDIDDAQIETEIRGKKAENNTKANWIKC